MFFVIWIWELTAQLLEMCTLDIIKCSYIHKKKETHIWKKKKNPSISNVDFGPVL